MNTRLHFLKNRSSFTLIELLVTIGIISILSLIVIIVINPVQLLKQGRDSTRLSDLSTINSALNVYQADSGGASMGTASTTYISIPDPTATSTTYGNSCTGLGLPALPSGYSYRCAASSTYRNTDGTGWVPVNFQSISSGSPMGTVLPVDPVNTTSSGNYYAFITPGGSWELTAVPESQKVRTSNQVSPLTGAIALGSDLALSPLFNPNGLVGYWKFDEGTGSAASDSSGNGNTGTLNGGLTWASGKLGNALNFNGSTGYVRAVNSASLSIAGSFTVSAWVNLNSTASNMTIMSKSSGGFSQNISYAIDFYSGNFLGTIGNTSSWTTNTITIPSLSVVAGTWYHVVFTTDGTNLKLFVNGQSNSSAQTITQSTNAQAVDIGAFVGGFFFSNGLIDDVRIYSRALSVAEVMALYNAMR